MTMSETIALQNARSLARLNRALPEVFPAPVLTHALARRFIPPMPRLAIDSYWRIHPVRADRLARALAARTGAPAGWTWRLAAGHAKDLPATFRAPPAPYRERKHRLGPGFCCVCGQPVYAFGWHVDLWDRGPNAKAQWHTACATAWRFWVAPHDFIRVLRKLQERRCAQSGGRLWRAAEVDHRVPLFRVWREHRDLAWPKLIDYWGLPNLQVINREVHIEKCADEASWRAARAP